MKNTTIALVGLAVVLMMVVLSCGSRDVPTPVEPPPVPLVADTIYIRDYTYVEGRIFDLAYPGEIGADDSVRVQVFEEELKDDNPDAEEMVLDAGSLDSGTSKTWLRSGVKMKQVPEDKWELLYGQDSSHCPIALVFYSGRRYAVGVRMDIMRSSGDIDSIGYLGAGTDTLRMIQPRTSSSDWVPEHPAWNLLWRNCYRIPLDCSIADIQVTVATGLRGREDILPIVDHQIVNGDTQGTFLDIIGLDQWNNSASSLKRPDGWLDERIEVFRPDWGLIIVPHREPFNTDTTFLKEFNERTAPLNVKVPNIYEYRSMTEKIENTQYFFRFIWTHEAD